MDVRTIEGPRPLDPRQVRVWTLGWGLVALVAVMLVVTAEVVVVLADGLDVPWPPGLPALAAAVGAGAAVWRLPAEAYRRWSYELGDTALVLRRGVIIERRTAIPYFRVQHIDITRSPIERAIGLSQLVVRTAAASTDATIPGIAETDAESLRDVILARTGRGDV